MFLTDPQELMGHVLQVQKFQQAHSTRLLRILKEKVLKQKSQIQQLKAELRKLNEGNVSKVYELFAFIFNSIIMLVHLK